MIKQYDLHGFTVPEAERLIDSTVAEIRQNNTPQEVEFITGSGIIKDAVKRILTLDYRLNPRGKLSNSGIVIVYIE